MKALIIGAGTFGSTLAIQLAAKKCEVLVIDSDASKLDAIKDRVGQVIVGDGTDKELLSKFAKAMDVIVVSLGEVIDASILIVLHLKELQVPRIIAKATNADHEKVLRIIGAQEVLNPERDEATRLATTIISPNVIDLMQLGSDMSIVELAVPESFYGRSLLDLDIRKKYGLHILAVRNPMRGTTYAAPSPDYHFAPDDMMIVLGEESGITKIRG